jgi:hypothetical protein
MLYDMNMNTERGSMKGVLEKKKHSCGGINARTWFVGGSACKRSHASSPGVRVGETLIFTLLIVASPASREDSPVREQKL